MAFVSTPLPINSSPSHLPSICSQRTTFTGPPLTRSNVTDKTTAFPSLPSRQSTTMVFGKTVKESLELSFNFKTLLSLAEAAGVDLDVSNCTLFAPSDAAFARTPPSFVENLLANPLDAKAIILRHVLPGRVLTSKQIKGCGFWDGVYGGPLAYEAIGAIVKVGNARIENESCDLECDNGTIHTIDTVLTSSMVKAEGVAKTFVPSVPRFTDSVAQTVSPGMMMGQRKSSEACLPASTGGRKAMGLMTQLPFWMYGPPFNAAKQEEYEPISIAQPDVSGVDYQLMPPGSVIVVPDEVSAAKLIPVSGMSKYIGKTKRLVEGDGLSDYSKLPY